MTSNTIRARAIAGSAALLATVVTIAAASPVRAEAVGVERVEALVAYGDLDLRTEVGRATLDRRIRFAADTVCGPLQPSTRFHVQSCRRDAVARAQANVAMAGIAGVRTAALR